MADRFPIILNTSANQLQEMPAGDSLDISGAAVKANLVDSLSVVGIGVSVAGIVTATSFVGSGANLSGIDISAVKDSGGNVKIQAEASGAIYTGIHTFGSTTSFTNGVFNGTVTSTGAVVNGDSDLNGDIDVEGDLDVDGHTNLDNVSIAGVTTFAGNVNSSGNITISNATPTIYLTDTDNNPDYSININGGHFEVRDVTNNSSRLQILSGGTVRSFGNFIAAKDLDVDGHTNLDNVSIAGVTTFSGGISGSTANLTGALTGTTANFSGNVTVGGVLTYEDVKNVDSIGIATARAGLKVLAGGANIVGVVTATSFEGDGSNLTGITQTTINSNVNNYLITGTGTANTLQGESGLTFNGSTLTVNSTTNEQLILSGATHPFIRFQEGTTDKAFIQWSGSGYLKLKNEEDGATLRLRDTIQFSTDDSTFYTMWHAGNDGAGSGLDADVLDGIQASSFVRSDATDTLTGEITLSNNLLKFTGTSNDRTVIHFMKGSEIKWRLLQNSYNAGGGDNLNFDRVNGTGIFMVDGYRVLTTSDINAQASGAVHSGISTFQDIDVDGHTNLDNVSIAGLTTFPDATSTTGRLYFGNDRDMQLWHSGNDGILYNSTGGFYIGGFGTGGITLQANTIRLRNGANNEEMIKCTANGAVEVYYDNSKKLETSDKGIKVGTGVTVETNGQATFTGIITATAFKLADGSAIGAGAGGTWSSYTAGIATSKSVGVNTSNLDDNDLVGVGNSFQGLYISNGMIIHDNTLRGNHYIGTAFNGLMAGPVNIEGTLSVDGSYVVV